MTDFTEMADELILAITNGDYDRVEALLVSGVNIESHTAQGFTPMIVASTQGNVDIVKLLVKFGANIRARSFFGTGCILCAAYGGHFCIVKYLLDLDADMLLSRPFEANELFQRAIDIGDDQMLRLFMEIGYDIMDGDNYPLVRATQRCRYDIIRWMTDIVDVNVETTDNNEWTSLHYSARDGKYDILEHLLVNHSCNVHVTCAMNVTPLMSAAFSGNTNIVRRFLDLMTDDDQDWIHAKDSSPESHTALSYAIVKGHLAIVKKILRRTDASSPHIDYPKLFHYACVGKQPEVIRYLIESRGKRITLTEEIIQGIENNEIKAFVIDLLAKSDSSVIKTSSLVVNP